MFEDTLDVLFVSTSVSVTLYERMSPFLLSVGGGCHDTVNDRDVLPITIIFSGGLAGAARNN